MATTQTTENKRVFTVTELTREIRQTLEHRFGELWLEGEVSNFKRYPSSGHFYFTLKDEQAQISGVMFRGDQRGLKFEPKNGLLVRVCGNVSVYEKGGNYQIIVRRMEESGQGTLQARFEALKKKLKEEGLFDPAHKKPIPMLPRHVGIVTSRSGAAIRDILNVLTRRFPNIHILLAPVRVQGDGAAAEIAEAIDFLNQRGGLDVLIVGRGGGSIEDLWCFNEEVVARAIFRSSIPVISAVGHETDFTISDFVADLRAPTPSAAAELVVNRKDAFADKLEEQKRRMGRALKETYLEFRNRLDAACGSYVFREPVNLVARYRQQMEAFRTVLGHTLESAARETGQKLDDWGMRMSHVVTLRNQVSRQTLIRLEGQLKALNPTAVLERGYSITRDEKGRILRSVNLLRKGQKIKTVLADGDVDSEITAVGRLEKGRKS